MVKGGITKLLLASAVFLIAGLLGGSEARAQAPSSVAPNNGLPQTPWLVVGRGGYDAEIMTVHIYVRDGGNARVHAHDLCDDNLAIDVASQRADTTATIEGGSVLGQLSCDNDTAVVSSNGGPEVTIHDFYNNPVQYRQISVVVRVVDYVGSGDYENSFRISSSTPGALVAYVSDPSHYTGIYNRSIDPTQRWSTSMDFAPPCNSGDNTDSIEFYDSDAHSGGYQDGSPIQWVLQRRLRLGGGYESYASGELNGGNNTLDVVSGLQFSDQYFYRLRLLNIERRNSVQVRLPFAQIWSRDHCASSVTVDPPSGSDRQAPFFVAQNGLVWSGGNIDANNLNVSGGYGEYSVLANGVITEFGSANSNSNSGLMFANNGRSGGFGFNALAGGGRAKKAYESAFQNVVSMPRGTIGDPGDLPRRVYKHTGDLHIDSNLVISDYNLGSGLDSVRSVTVLVDGDVNISHNVNRLDAVIIATGDLNTCANSSGLSYSPSLCAKNLVINGSLIADGYIFLNRVGTFSDRRGELIRATPETTLDTQSLPEGGTKLGKFRELPPVIGR